MHRAASPWHSMPPVIGVAGLRLLRAQLDGSWDGVDTHQEQCPESCYTEVMPKLAEAS